MARKYAAEIAQALMAAGRKQDEPAAIIANAARSGQSVTVTDLKGLGAAAEKAPRIQKAPKVVRTVIGNDKVFIRAPAGNALGLASTYRSPLHRFLDTATAAHFLSLVGLLFEVGLECAPRFDGVRSIGFSGKTVSNRKQKVS